ncbi:hypothetical protein MBLNU459_g3222t1 [Dothideomycetes sp. NU459]
MASSPPGSALSPPQPHHLSLPKKRPSISLPPNQPSHKRRKPSSASASAHPLRQTSFPPPDRGDSRAYSPDTVDSRAIYSPTSRRSESLDVDDEINSTVSGRTGGGGDGAKGKKPRGEKRAGRGRVGRPPKPRGDTASLIDGETSGRKGTSTHAGQADEAAGAAGDDGGEEGDNDDDDDDADTNTLEGGKLTRAAMELDKERRAMFTNLTTLLNPHHEQLFAQYLQVHLDKAKVRRLTNQTLSQSVPASVVTTINSYTKIFVGELVDRAREVQKEWLAAAETLPTGDKNEEAFGKDGEGEPKVRERDRGPLLPDHLREALRRYKGGREGGTVGFTGLSLEGRENTSVRNGGRRLFR